MVIRAVLRIQNHNFQQIKKPTFSYSHSSKNFEKSNNQSEKPLALHRLFHETRRFFKVFKVTRTVVGCFILIFSKEQELMVL
jgi:hypothetical protein